MDLEKSVESSISSAWAETYGGELISRMGRDRRRKVRDAVSRAIKRNQTVKNLARTLKRDAASTRDQGRDWERVARTEVNNANAMASYELIVELYGPKTMVYRDASNCCHICGEAFGEDKPKKWVISEIPRELRGSVHPNCKCSAWRVVKNPELFKAMSEPVGIVRRDGTGGYEISVGNGAWVSVGSVTARCVFRHYLSRVPFVVTDYLDRYWILRHGFGGKHKRGETILLDPRRVNNITFYHQSPFLIQRPHRAEARMVGAKTWDAYLEYMVDVLPGVIAMPEFWASDQKMRLLSDFLGYNSLTNWTITKSGEIDKAAILYQGRSESIRGLVKFYAKKLLNEDDLRKHHASKVHDKKSRDGVRGTGKRSIVYRCDR